MTRGRRDVLLLCPDARIVEAYPTLAGAERARDRVVDRTSGDRVPVVVTLDQAAAVPALLEALDLVELDPELQAAAAPGLDLDATVPVRLTLRQLRAIRAAVERTRRRG